MKTYCKIFFGVGECNFFTENEVNKWLENKDIEIVHVTHTIVASDYQSSRNTPTYSICIFYRMELDLFEKKCTNCKHFKYLGIQPRSKFTDNL